ncbi:MAG TPA: hypothetical protein VMH04_07625 [Candidatus Solibacter sp.]|nr:hypothetical protein [Candidatus Solibacter sp.]
MPSSRFAEWMLSRFIGRSRASTVVGDLLETTQRRGDLWFWTSVASVIVWPFWRKLFGYIAAFFLADYVSDVLSHSIHNVYATHQPTMNIAMLLGALEIVAKLLWMNSAYSLFRFGFKDHFAQLALALSGLATASVYFWWSRPVILPCLFALTLVIFLSVLTASRRAALLALTGAVGLGFVGWYAVVVGANVLHHHDRDASVLIYLVTSATDVVIVLIALTACSRMRRVFSPAQQLSPSLH